MLTLKNVSAGYNGVDAVKNISFQVKTGENLSVIGPNGCGKTTLLKAVAGLLPYRGSVEIDDIAVTKIKPRELSRKIAFLAQLSGVYFSYTVYDTVMMGRYPHIQDRLLGLPSEADKEVTLRCLEAVDLLDDKDREITRLSGGQLQRVFLARTLAQDPEIILLDEPTNHLDLKYQLELVEYLHRWASQKKRTVIGVLHDISMAMQLSDNILIMKDGESAAQGKTATVVTRSILERVYDIDVAGYMTDTLKRWENLST